MEDGDGRVVSGCGSLRVSQLMTESYLWRNFFVRVSARSTLGFMQIQYGKREGHRWQPRAIEFDQPLAEHPDHIECTH